MGRPPRRGRAEDLRNGTRTSKGRPPRSCGDASMKTKGRPVRVNASDSVRGLVNVAYIFRRVLLLSLERPWEEVLAENATSLDLADRALDEWIEQVEV